MPGIELAGLTLDEVSARLTDDGPNEIPRPQPPSLPRRMVSHLVEPLSLVLLAAAAASIAVLGHLVEGCAIAAIVVLNVAIGAVQEDRADQAVAALADLTAPTARARRGGTTMIVPARDLVVGDVVELAAGDRVPADIELTEATSFAVDEAVLTGESLPVAKDADGDRAFAGTHAVRGRAVGVVLATGGRTQLGMIALALDAPVQPPLVRELRSVAAVMSAVAVALGSLLVPVAAARGQGDDALGDAILAGVALAIAAIPEGLGAVVMISLAIGARSMAARGAIVRRLPSLETLGSTSVICTDKTGTLTTGHVAVAHTHPVGTEASLWHSALRCVDAADGTGDPIDVAIVEAAAAAGHHDAGGTRVAERPFDAAARTMTTLTLVDGSPVVTVKGAPEVVLARCRPSAATVLLEATGDQLTGQGLRVLAVAHGASNDLDAQDLEPIGLLAFADPLRPSTVGAVAACRRAGIRVVMVTGDHLATAITIARAAGMDSEPAITDESLASLEPSAATNALRDAAVLARVAPATKVALVAAHRAAGDVVAMTGDGVNDALALRAADIGVALAGESGTDVAREAAGLVVTSGDLGTIVDAIREGRRVYRNVTHVVGYLLAGNLSEILVVATCLVFVPELAVPLLPVQLLWLNLVTDGLPALALGADRTPSDLLDAPPRRVGDPLLNPRRLGRLAGRSIAVSVPVVLVALWARRRGWQEEVVRTQLLLALITAHLLLAYASRAAVHSFEGGWWRNRLVLGAVGGSMLLQLPMFTTGPGRSLLGLAALPAAGWLAAGMAAASAIAVIDVVRGGMRVLQRRRADRGRAT